MQPSTQVMFSLPNRVKGEDGLEGCCTIAAIDKLQTLQNAMLLTFRRVEAETAAVVAGGGGGGTNGAPAAPTSVDAVSPAPAVNYLTDKDVLKHQLVTYDRASQVG